LPKDEYELIVVMYVDDVVKNVKGKSLLADLISYRTKTTLAIEKAEGDAICSSMTMTCIHHGDLRLLELSLNIIHH
jgi:hypothetical protein